MKDNRVIFVVTDDIKQSYRNLGLRGDAIKHSSVTEVDTGGNTYIFVRYRDTEDFPESFRGYTLKGYILDTYVSKDVMSILNSRLRL